MLIKRAASLLLAAAMIFSFSACKKSGPKNANKTIKYNLSAEPVTLDPQIAADSSSIITVQAIFEGLARLDKNGNAEPGTAESWEHNADSTEFTFHLRPDISWAPKKYGAVKAKDFVFAFQRALNPTTASSTCTAMFCIKNAKQIHAGSIPASQLGVTAKDDKTLTVSLAYSCPDFPKLTALPVYMPCNESFFKSSEGRYGLESKYTLGNGPFCIDGAYGWEHGKYLNLARSSSYSGQTKPFPAAVDFTIGTLPDSVAALTGKTVDAAPISSSQIGAAKSSGCTLTSFRDTTWGLCFNTQSSVFKNLKVRSGFLQAFSRAKVLSHLPAGTSKAENILFPETMIDGQNYRALAGGPFYLKESTSAAQTLFAGLRELNLDSSSLDSVTVLCPDNSNIKLMLNEMIAAWNKQFSNYFNMKTMSLSSLESHVQSGDYEIAVCPVKPSDSSPLAMLSLFSSGSSSNPCSLKDSAYDSLLVSAQEKGGKEAAAVYAQAEKYLNQHAVFYPLYYEDSYYALAKGVTGIVFRPYGSGIDFLNAGKESS